MAFIKLFGSILASTVWELDTETRVVWITMLAMADQYGHVPASIPGLATIARVEIGAVERAIAILSSPDKYSRNQENDGRRIGKVDGGWNILNHGHYRHLESLEDRREKDRNRQQRHRAKTPLVTHAVDSSRDVTLVTGSEADQIRSRSEADQIQEREAEPHPTGGSPLAPAAQGPTRGAKLRGTRIAEGWTPRDETLARLRGEGCDPDASLASFVDYWTARAGAGGVKLDWDATFRVWVRREGKARKSSVQVASPIREAYEAGLREILGDAAPALTWDEADAKALGLAIDRHAATRRDGTPRPPDKYPAWIRGAAADFAEALRASPEGAKFYSDGSARGLLRWLNREALASDARKAGT